jgi:hypothetical protein
MRGVQFSEAYAGHTAIVREKRAANIHRKGRIILYILFFS